MTVIQSMQSLEELSVHQSVIEPARQLGTDRKPKQDLGLPHIHSLKLYLSWPRLGARTRAFLLGCHDLENLALLYQPLNNQQSWQVLAEAPRLESLSSLEISEDLRENVTAQGGPSPSYRRFPQSPHAHLLTRKHAELVNLFPNIETLVLHANESGMRRSLASIRNGAQSLVGPDSHNLGGSIRSC